MLVKIARKKPFVPKYANSEKLNRGKTQKLATKFFKNAFSTFLLKTNHWVGNFRKTIIATITMSCFLAFCDLRIYHLKVHNGW